MIKPKIVFIDWHNALSDYKFFWHLEKSKRKTEIDLFNRITNCLFIEDTSTSRIPDWLRGKYTTEQILKDVSDNIGADFNVILDEFIKSCKTMKLVSPNILSIITKLKKQGIRFYLATDNMDSFERWVIPELILDKTFDGILNSYNLGALKMDMDKHGNSMFFTKILELENIEPFETILFDDSEDKDGRLTKYGINYVRIDKENNLESNLLKLLSKGYDNCSNSHED